MNIYKQQLRELRNAVINKASDYGDRFDPRWLTEQDIEEIGLVMVDIDFDDIDFDAVVKPATRLSEQHIDEDRERRHRRSVASHHEGKREGLKQIYDATLGPYCWHAWAPHHSCVLAPGHAGQHACMCAEVKS